MKFRAALITAAVSGFVGLSYELLWYRVYAVANYSKATSFPQLLAAYLFGLAAGALVVRAAMRRVVAPARALLIAAIVFQLTSALAFLSIPLYAAYCAAVPAGRVPWLGFMAAALGAVFPLIAHSGVAPDDRAGAHVSYLYVANILGSTLGSLLTGFVLMDLLSLRAIAVVLLLFAAASGTLLLLACDLSRPRWLAALVASAACAVGLSLASSSLFDRVYERALYANKNGPDFHFSHVLENRNGVITVGPADIVHGSGTYDGAFNIDLVHDVNGIFRAFFFGAVHERPKHVLMIGLGSGSWAQIVAHHPAVEKLTVVEINPGYQHLIPLYPDVASLPRNPKVQVETDDIRHWLLRHPDARFDAVVANAGVHWVGSSSHILSSEFFALLHQHLLPGGVVCFNSTGSRRAMRSMSLSFRHVLDYRSYVCGSDAPLVVAVDRWREQLSSWNIDGRPVLELSRDADRAMLEQLTREAGQLREFREHDLDGSEPITDDNMGHEWDW